jgi:hypothetical protein
MWRALGLASTTDMQARGRPDRGMDDLLRNQKAVAFGDGGPASEGHLHGEGLSDATDVVLTLSKRSPARAKCCPWWVGRLGIEALVDQIVDRGDLLGAARPGGAGSCWSRRWCSAPTALIGPGACQGRLKSGPLMPVEN